MKTNTSLFFYESSSCSIERDNSTKDNPTPSMFADYYPGEDGALKKCPVVIFSERASLSRGRMPRSGDGNTEFNTDSPYRYAFQGQEKDPETGKEAFQLRLYDSRINRWLTTDPAGQYASPYLAMGNNWVSRIDPDGGTDGDPSDGAVVYGEDIPGFGGLPDGWFHNGIERLDEVSTKNGLGYGFGILSALAIEPVLSTYGNKVSNILKNKSSFSGKSFVVGGANSITSFRQQDFESYMNKSSKFGGSWNVVDKELRTSMKLLKGGVKWLGRSVSAAGGVFSTVDYINGEIGGEIYTLDLIMTGVGMTGAGTIPAGIYFIGVRAPVNHLPSNYNMHNEIEIRKDNTRVHLNNHKNLIIVVE